MGAFVEVREIAFRPRLLGPGFLSPDFLAFYSRLGDMAHEVISPQEQHFGQQQHIARNPHKVAIGSDKFNLIVHHLAFGIGLQVAQALFTDHKPQLPFRKKSPLCSVFSALFCVHLRIVLSSFLSRDFLVPIPAHMSLTAARP